MRPTPTPWDPGPGPIVFEELGAGHVALDCAGGPIELESIHDGGEVCLDSACEAHERTEPTGLRILQPIGEIVRALTHDQTSKALEQLVSGGEALVVIQ